MNIAIDIDGTISVKPEYFRRLAQKIRSEGGRVHIVSSRSPLPEVYNQTEKDLQVWGIGYDKLHLIPEMGSNVPDAPKELDWYQKYLYGKITYCKANKIDVYYDDDNAVSVLFEKYSSEIKFVLV